MHITAIHVGQPRTLGGADDPAHGPREWVTAIAKQPVNERTALGTTNLAGDRQGDLSVHGGPDKAVCVYPAAHFPYWNQQFDGVAFGAGAFGENLTVADADEETVCIGDVWSMGTAVVQISQPRRPCWKLGRRHGLPRLPAMVHTTGRTGWYLRVHQPGELAPGDTIELQDRPHPEWTLTRANRVMLHRAGGQAAAKQLAGVAALATSWRETLTSRAQRTTSPP